MRKATNKDGTRQTTVVKRVLKMRDQDNLSWTDIKMALREGKSPIVVSGSTVRRIYDEGHGRKGAHHDSRPLSGGRYVGDKHPDGTTGHQPKRDKPSDKGKPVTKATAANTKALAKSAAAKKAPAKKATAARKAPAKKATPGTATRATRKPAAKAPEPTVEDRRRAAAAEAAEG